ncbi:MAG TPA: hypothetical protein VFY18_03420 [Candidatus Limnocylindrales bacterium]|nr:hypothetical protein [Candidatus Limnocylindrales bacterium]
MADPDLFEILPDMSDAFDLTYDPETTAAVAGDPSLDSRIAAVATGLYRIRGSAPDAADFAIVNVARLREPIVDEAWFRDWRDTYDVAACRQAGGVAGHAQAQIHERTLFIGSCTGGLFTYHVLIDGGAIVVSITSVGPARMGLTVMQRMTP